MATHIVIDGNAFYEVDEECMKRMEHRTQKINVRAARNRQPERPVSVRQSRAETK